jgi:hypothetical protein
VTEVDLDEDALCTCFGGEVIIGLIDKFTGRAGRARKEDNGTTILCQVEQAIYIL